MHPAHPTSRPRARRPLSRRPLAALLLPAALAALALPARADTLRIPSEYPSLLAALGDAAPGDTILFADGVYGGRENLALALFGPLTLASENGPANCTFDAGGGPAFLFIFAEPPSLVFDGFTFTNGFGTPGGAVFVHHDAAPTFRDCIFEGNVSNGGGAVYCDDQAAPTFIRCEFRGNLATQGGAVYAIQSSRPTFRQCVFRDNVSQGDGGALLMHGIGETMLVNCTFVGNRADLSGGAVFVRHGRMTLEHVTMAHNTAGLAGGGLGSLSPLDPLLRNSIVWGNQALAGSQIVVSTSPITNPGTLTVQHSDVQGGQAGVLVVNGASLTWGAGNLDVDPALVDGPGGDLRLLGGSPVIDQGDPAGATAGNDLLGFGHPRLDDGDFDGVARVDMGAVEFGGLLSDGTTTAGALTTVRQWGPPGALAGLFVGLPDGPLDLGVEGTFFLDVGGPLELVGLASLGPTGSAPLLSALVPAALSGLDVHFQAVSQAAQPPHLLHWTNLETLAVE